MTRTRVADLGDTCRVRVETLAAGDHIYETPCGWAAIHTAGANQYGQAVLNVEAVAGLWKGSRGEWIIDPRTIVTARLAPRCLICDGPEGCTEYGQFEDWCDGKVHRGCLLDRDSSTASDHELGATR